MDIEKLKKIIDEIVDRKIEEIRIRQRNISPKSVIQSHINGLIIFRGDSDDLPSDGSTEIQIYYEEDSKKLKIWNTTDSGWDEVQFG